MANPNGSDDRSRSLSVENTRRSSTSHTPDEQPTLSDSNDEINNEEPSTLDLWSEAYSKLDDKTKKWIGTISVTIKDQDSILELVAEVRSIEEKYKDATPKLQIGHREILWRDYADKVVSWLIIIGDIAIPFAPAPSSTIWSAVKKVLTIAIWERLGRLTGKVNRRLQKLLELLASADTKLKQRHLKQFLAALIDPEQYEERVTGLRGLGRELVEAADVCGHESAYESRSDELMRGWWKSFGNFNKMNFNKLWKALALPQLGHNKTRGEETARIILASGWYKIDTSSLGERQASLPFSGYKVMGENTDRIASRQDEVFAFFYSTSSSLVKQQLRHRWYNRLLRYTIKYLIEEAKADPKQLASEKLPASKCSSYFVPEQKGIARHLVQEGYIASEDLKNTGFPYYDEDSWKEEEDTFMSTVTTDEFEDA
ncbi:hypothetical protein LZL87_013727 [Fusarium oxysporum]|nr:hypothetical protein LZL87_013727 [Fusarium oxysporum]